MENYRLDDLGWYQFERMCQALLKALYGIGVEAWGGTSDLGRDAYTEGPLYYPEPQVERSGPFVFQVKFVENANNPRADPLPTLSDAVRRECRRIKSRLEKGLWQEVPSHYTLLTNAPVNTEARSTLSTLIRSVLPSTRSLIQGGSDLSAILDDQPRIRLAYPQVLGLRDLRELLSQAVAADVRTRSTLSLQLAEQLAPVFVSTKAYARAIGVLGKHHFVVITGPPEMGKTAIARMISLAQHSSGWEAYDLREPRELFRVYSKDSPQLFLADDTFGSTEYRPERADEWAGVMDRLLAACDSNHWLVWTSRPAPLKEGLRQLHIQGVGSVFPQPNEVQVDASVLSEMEKGQMLYRHAKAAGLSDDAKLLLKTHITKIIEHKHFTPFRLHRFIAEQLPEVMKYPKLAQLVEFDRAVQRAMQEPTRAMSTSFNALGEEQRALLVSMLNASGAEMSAEFLAESMANYLGRPPLDSTSQLIDLLDNHFVRTQE